MILNSFVIQFNLSTYFQPKRLTFPVHPPCDIYSQNTLISTKAFPKLLSSHDLFIAPWENKALFLPLEQTKPRPLLYVTNNSYCFKHGWQKTLNRQDCLMCLCQKRTMGRPKARSGQKTKNRPGFLLHQLLKKQLQNNLSK